MSVAVPVATTTSRPRRTGRLGVGKIGVVCLGIIGFATFVAVFGSLLAPHDPNASNFDNVWIGPFQEPGHLLGFDGQGRDLLSRLLVGARTAVLGPLAVVSISVILGAVLAVFAAWKGGRVDGVLGSLFDVLFAFPGILLAILAAAVFGKGIGSAVVALSIAYVPFIARVLRSAALKVRSQPYVAALEVQGQSSWKICTHHIVPNIGSHIVAQATTLFGYAMVDLAAISFLGLGVQAPAADWGYMVNENQSGILQGYPFPTIISGLLIVIVVVAVNVLGERLHQRTTAGTRT
jgi:peptide/nickel transport system permease protein